MNDNYIHSLNAIDSTNYTAESIASSLIKKGVLIEKIFLKPLGTSKRSHKQDVSIIHTPDNNNTNQDLFFLESPREGIYNTLPEAIFHSFSGSKNSTNKSEIIEEIKKHREEEKQARLFFLPFEQEFFNIKRTLVSFDEAFECLSNASNFIAIYQEHYPVLHILPLKKGYLFLRLLPFIHDIRDDFEKVEECLRILLDFNVTISPTFKKTTINSYTPPQLGFATLGTDTIIGSYCEDGEPDLDIILTPINFSALEDYSFLNKTKKLTEQLCDFFIGAQYEVTISFQFDVLARSAVMDTRALLGYNVYL